MSRDAAPPPSRQSRVRFARNWTAPLARLNPWWALIVVVLLVLASAPFAIAPVRDAVTLSTLPEAVLRRPLGYVLIAPVSDVLDLLALLSLRQHVALLLT